MIDELPRRIAKRYPYRNSIMLVQEGSKLLFNLPMNIKQIRHHHFIRALEERFGGSLEDMASGTDSNPKYLSQIKNGVRNIGDRTAARLEKALGLPAGTWDVSPQYPTPYRETDPEEVRELVQLYELASPVERKRIVRMVKAAVSDSSEEQNEST